MMVLLVTRVAIKSLEERLLHIMKCTKVQTLSVVAGAWPAPVAWVRGNY